MLYVTTRSDQEQYPALRTLGQDKGPDGGGFVPYRLPRFTEEELMQLQEQSFGGCVAAVLDRLFFPRLNGVELDFALGRAPVRIAVMNHRIAVAELWHNIFWDYEWIAEQLVQRLRVDSQAGMPVTQWPRLAASVAVLFGAYGQLQRSGALEPLETVDIAVPTGDFRYPMAAWYARSMGLPLGNIICCGASSGPWDLLHHGQVRTADPLPEGVERLIAACLGPEAAVEYQQVCGRRGVYAPGEEALERLRQGMYASVVSPRRTKRTMGSIYSTNHYPMGPETATVYAGLQDYRASAGEGRLALILAVRRPADDLEAVAEAVGIDSQELKRQLD